MRSVQKVNVSWLDSSTKASFSHPVSWSLPLNLLHLNSFCCLFSCKHKLTSDNNLWVLSILYDALSVVLNFKPTGSGWENAFFNMAHKYSSFPLKDSNFLLVLVTVASANVTKIRRNCPFFGNYFQTWINTHCSVSMVIVVSKKNMEYTLFWIKFELERRDWF